VVWKLPSKLTERAHQQTGASLDFCGSRILERESLEKKQRRRRGALRCIQQPLQVPSLVDGLLATAQQAQRGTAIRCLNVILLVENGVVKRMNATLHEKTLAVSTAYAVKPLEALSKIAVQGG
jgi:hypothetical protein